MLGSFPSISQRNFYSDSKCTRQIISDLEDATDEEFLKYKVLVPEKSSGILLHLSQCVIFRKITTDLAIVYTKIYQNFALII